MTLQDPMASLPLEKAHNILRKKRKRKAVADPWNIFLKFIPPIFFCFILSGKHSPLAAMHTIPRSLWANRNEVETGGLSQRVLAVWSVLAAKAELFPAALHIWAPPVLGAASRRMAGQHQTYSWQCLWLLGLCVELGECEQSKPALKGAGKDAVWELEIERKYLRVVVKCCRVTVPEHTGRAPGYTQLRGCTWENTAQDEQWDIPN